MTIRPAITSAGAAVLGCLLLAPAAFAAGGESTPLNLGGASRAAQPTTSSGGGGMVRTIVGLAVVLGVIYGLHWVLKQVKASKDERASGNGLAPLATLPLGGNRSLALVRAGREVVLVGVGDGSVTPIRTYAEEEARALGLVVEEIDGAGSEAAAVPGASRFSLFVSELRRRTVIR
jgi:flagellar protein FliO/FliZ